MTRETRIGLLVGLAFIVTFGLVLSELMNNKTPATTIAAVEDPGPPARLVPPSQPPEAAPVVAVTADSRAVPAPVDDGLPRIPVAAGAPTALRLTAIDAPPPPAGATAPPDPVPPAAAAPAAPAAQAKVTHKVQSGDSLGKIARKYYGPAHEREYVRIFQANRHILSDESTLAVGQELVIPPMPGVTLSPPASQLPATAPDPVRPSAPPPAGAREMSLDELARHLSADASGRPSVPIKYVVRSGDSLGKIAGKLMGDSSRAAALRLFKANRTKLKSIDDVPVGVELTIPR